jgi:hypothetical protein
VTALSARPADAGKGSHQTHRVHLNGLTVGPLFTDDLEEAHFWVAEDHPGQHYSIVTTSNHVAVASGFGTFRARGTAPIEAV